MVLSLLKWLGIVVVGAVLAVVSWKNFLFDEAQLRQQISEQVKLNSGLALEIRQPLELELFPSLSLQGREMVLQTEKPQPIVIERLDLEIALSPLLNQQLVVRRLEADVDGAHWSGSAMLQPQGASGIVRFNLQGDQLDLDRYLPASSKGEAVDPVAGSAVGVVQLPLQPLRDLDLDGEVTLGQLRVAGAEVTELKLKLHAKEGVVTVGPLFGALYGGEYRGTNVVDVRKESPLIELDESLQGVDLGPLLQALGGVDALRGTLLAKGNIQAVGTTQKQIVESLDGHAKVQVNDGALIGFNLRRTIRQARALIEGKPLPADHEPNETRFDELEASVRVEQGRVTSDDLKIETDVMTLTGSGWVEISSQQVSYQLVAKIADQLSADQQSELGKLAGQSFPIHITGSLSKPRVKADLDEILKQGLQQKLKEKIGGKLQQFLGQPKVEEGQPTDGQKRAPSQEEQLKQNFGNMLQKLF